MIDNIKNEAMVLLILNNYTSRKALTLLLGGRCSVTNALRDMKESGWIKERTVVYKDKNRKEKKIVYYMITARGFNSFLEEIEKSSNDGSSKVFEYAKWMRGMMPMFQALDCSMNLTSEKIIKHLDLSTASLIAFAVGASFSPLLATVGSKEEEQNEKRKTENKISLAQIVNEGVSKYTDADSEVPPYLFPNSHIRFTNARDIKHITIEQYKSSVNIMYGRFTGIFEAPGKAVITYAPPIRGMSWNRWVVNGEILAYQIFLSQQGIYSIDPFSDIRAAIFVENVKMFDQLMHDYHEKRTANEVLGGGLSEFLVFPLTKYGVDRFHDYLLDDRNAIEQRIVKQITKFDDFSENKIGDDILFPLVENNGVPVTIGVYIDIVKINRLISYPSDMDYAIICYGWQEEFYRKILKPTEYIIID